MADQRRLPVPDGLVGERVDVAVTRLTGISRARVQNLIADGRVLVDGERPAASLRLTADQWIDVEIVDAAPAALVVEPTEVPGMAIIHDDDDIVVIDKPAWVAAHPSAGWSGPTVVGALAAAGFRISTSGPPERQGIVQRLDVGTSGLMTVAKSERAYTHLKRAFRNREVAKTYHSVVQGHPDPPVGTIDAPIGRRPGRDFRFAVRTDGKPAITHYEVLEMHRAASLLEINLETGRTHQIRVHFSALHHPCAGDPVYGSDPILARRLKLERQWLHAVRLSFEHPGTGSTVEFQSPYPADLQGALGILRED